MSMNIMSPDGEFQVPAGWAGQAEDELSLESTRPLTNRAVTKALQIIDHDIDQLTQLKASLTGYGFGKICPVGVTDVTQADGIILGGFEKNPAVEGSLAYIAEQIEAKRNSVFSKTDWGDQDFNDVRPEQVNKFKCYYMFGSGSDWKNCFTTGNFYGLMLAGARTSMNYLFQIFFDYYTGLHMRIMSAGNWSAWKNH